MSPTTDTTPTDKPITRQDHPSWCYGHDCYLYRLPNSGRVAGQHEAYRQTVETQYGVPVRIGTGAEHDDERESLRVTLIFACTTDAVPQEEWPDDGRGDAPLDLRTRHGERVQMQPEEARLVARYLLEQADRVERLRDELSQ